MDAFEEPVVILEKSDGPFQADFTPGKGGKDIVIDQFKGDPVFFCQGNISPLRIFFDPDGCKGTDDFRKPLKCRVCFFGCHHSKWPNSYPAWILFRIIAVIPGFIK